jgi:hypothetical protein
MKNKKQIIFYGMIALLFMQIPVLKADSVTRAKREFQLTTYYPAPHGDYKNINTTEDARLATSSGSVGIGTTSPHKDAKLEVNNTLRLTPVTGNAAAQKGGAEGAIRYSKDAGGANVGGLLYKNASGWMPLAGTSQGQGTVVTRWNHAGTQMALNGGYTKGVSIGEHLFCAIANVQNAEDGHYCRVYKSGKNWYIENRKTACQAVCLD